MNDTPTTSPTHDIEAIRDALLRRSTRRSQRVTFAGVTFDVRNPTLADRRKLATDSAGDPTVYNVLAVITCTFVPDTEQRFFSVSDVDALLATETGGLVDVLAGHITAVMRSAAEETATLSKG